MVFLTDSQGIDSGLTPFPLDSSWQFGHVMQEEFSVLGSSKSMEPLWSSSTSHESQVKFRWNMIQVRLQILQFRLGWQSHSSPYFGCLKIAQVSQVFCSSISSQTLMCLFPQDAKSALNHLNGPKFKSNSQSGPTPLNLWLDGLASNKASKKQKNFQLHLRSEPQKDQHQQGLHSTLQTLAGPRHHSFQDGGLSLQNDK